ncbi:MULTISPECIES: hypothetical protein [unclassified Streptomyces]|uniref:hypothetical protein n=1 Tax=unclassified Streptomyces TaxID=2593676 RepID=UPI002B1CC695|nr:MULTISPECIES: hypothetical protein [unclassified Streptomyces]
MCQVAWWKPVQAATTAPKAPVKTRETASPRFHQALAAHQAAAPAQRVDPGIAEAGERQTKAMRELSRLAFPEPPLTEGQPPSRTPMSSATARPAPPTPPPCDGRGPGGRA